MYVPYVLTMKDDSQQWTRTIPELGMAIDGLNLAKEAAGSASNTSQFPHLRDDRNVIAGWNSGLNGILRRVLNRANNRPSLHNTNPVPSPPPVPRPSADAEGLKPPYRDILDLASKLRSSSPPTCTWLDPTDLQDIGECSIDGGRFTDVWRARLDGRVVAVKSYRCYVGSDCDRIRTVSYNKHRYYPSRHG